MEWLTRLHKRHQSNPSFCVLETLAGEPILAVVFHSSCRSLALFWKKGFILYTVIPVPFRKRYLFRFNALHKSACTRHFMLALRFVVGEGEGCTAKVATWICFFQSSENILLYPKCGKLFNSTLSCSLTHMVFGECWIPLLSMVKGGLSLDGWVDRKSVV